MSIIGKTITSKASGFRGMITGIEGDVLKVTFTGTSNISIPLSRAVTLLEMDEDTQKEIEKQLGNKKTASENKESKVPTYMDDFEEEEEDEEEGLPPLLDFEEDD